MREEGNDILSSAGDTRRMLALSRSGTLFFFALLVGVTAAWGAILVGRAAALAAVAALCCLPPVLAHAGLATTDVAFTATLCGALMALTWWLQRGVWVRAVAAGLAAGVALCTKFSFLVLYPPCAAVLVGLHWRQRRSEGDLHGSFWPFCWRQTLLSAAAALLAVVAIYRCSFGPLRDPSIRLNEEVVSRFGEDPRFYAIVHWPYYPIPEFFHGLHLAASHAAQGHSNYFLGEVRTRGTWYFYPVLLAVKTPVGFWLLVFAGAVLLSRRAAGVLPQAPLWCGGALLLAALPSTINLGLRHILPLYPMAAMAAGYAVAEGVRRGGRSRLAALGALATLAVSSASAHPDYLSYFNFLAGREPERIQTDSDLDWGQDLYRLEAELKRLRVDSVHVALFGTADLDRLDLPKRAPLTPHRRATGWIAVSTTRLFNDGTAPPFDGYAWLRQYTPVARAGQIRIYRIEE